MFVYQFFFSACFCIHVSRQVQEGTFELLLIGVETEGTGLGLSPASCVFLALAIV